MADTVDISAIARVTDLASPVIKAITGAITGMGNAAQQATAAVAGMSGRMAGTVGQMVGGLGRAGGEIEGFGKKIAGMFGPLQGLAGAATLTGMTAAVVSLVGQAKKLDDLSQALHVTAGMLEAFERAAGGPEAADAALKHLHDTMASIAAGGKDADSIVALMHKFGVTAKEIADGNLDVILPRIAAGFAANTDPALRSRMALALFGEEGRKLIPFLAQGPAGVKALAAEMERLGLAAKIPAAAEAGKALDALSQSVTDAKNAIAAAIIPAFVPLVNVVTRFVNANQELLKQTALPAFLGLITTSVVALGVALWGVLAPWMLVVGAIVAGATAIYLNWGKVKAFFDETLPGFLPALQQASTGIAAWAAQASADITKGFQTGGISGGLEAVWTSLKTGATDAVAWITNTFKGINWAEVGTAAGQGIWNALLAFWQAEIGLGKVILDQMDAINWGQVGQSIIDGITAYISAVGDVWSWFASLDWANVGLQIGKLLGQAIVLTFRAANWLVELPFNLVDAFVNADYSKIGTAIAAYFSKLGAALLKIGGELIGGLIDGMMAAIPGLSRVVNAAKGILGDIGGFFDAANAKIADLTSRRTGADIQGGIGNPLTPQLAAGGGGTLRSQVDTNVNVTAPPGATVTATQTQSGAPVRADVNVGPSGVAAPVH
jgi:hypothetical protein